MADLDMEDKVIEDIEETQDYSNTQEYGEEDLELFKRFKIDPENFTAEDLKVLTKRLYKSENAVIESKKNKSKESPALTEKDLEVRDFIKENPDYVDYKEDIQKYIKQGFTIKQAKSIIDSSDKTIENRKKTNSMNITNTEGVSKTSFTKNELAKMSQKDYENAMNSIETGKANLV